MNLCEICDEYSPDELCEYRESCRLYNVAKEVENLRKENKELKEKIDAYRISETWRENPDNMGR